VNKVLISWSSGKDSAWMVHVLRRRAVIQLAGLLTTVNEAAQRVAMHAVRTEVLEAQAAALGLPLWPIPIPSPCPNEVYERAIDTQVARLRKKLEKHGASAQLIGTERGAGYVLTASVEIVR